MPCCKIYLKVHNDDAASIKLIKKNNSFSSTLANSATCTLINNCSHSKTDTCRLAADSRTTEFQNNIVKQILNQSLSSRKSSKRTQNF